MRASRLQQFMRFYQNLASRQNGEHHRVSGRLGIAELYDGAAIAATVDVSVPHYMNHGYWHSDTDSTMQASRNLMQIVVDNIHAHSASDGGEIFRLLDVACGLGATSEYFADKFPRASVCGINVTERQINLCRQVAPGCKFLLMDATELNFPSGEFDCVVCIEAAFQFRTRARFLGEAFRVLRKGGVLVITDVLVEPETHSFVHMFSEHHPPENQVADCDAYLDLMLRSGFTVRHIADITESGARSFFRFQVAALSKYWQLGRLSFVSLQRQLEELWLLDCILKTQLLCVAIK